MKKLFLFLNLFFILFIAGTGESLASKKYRYIKREHGVRFQGHIPMSVIRSAFALKAHFGGAYAYNWKGWAEIGPYFDLGAEMSGGFSLSRWSFGLLGEYNFIKNRGKRKLIPSLGLTVGAVDDRTNPTPTAGAVDDRTNPTPTAGGPHLALGVHVSLKSFVAKRTAFITTLGYSLQTPTSGLFQSLTHHPSVKMAFSYYFDFY